MSDPITYGYLPVSRLPEQVPMSTPLRRRRDVHRLVDTVANFHPEMIEDLDREYRDSTDRELGAADERLGERAAEQCPLVGLLCRSDIGTDGWTQDLLEALDAAECVDWDEWAQRQGIRVQLLEVSHHAGDVVELTMKDGARETWALASDADLQDPRLRRHLIWGMLSDERPHPSIVLTEH